MSRMMTISNQKLIWNEELYRIDRQVDDQTLQLEHITTGRFKECSLKDFQTNYIDGKITLKSNDISSNQKPNRSVIAPLDHYPENEVALCKRRYLYVKSVLDNNVKHFTKKTLQPIIENIYLKENNNSLKKPHWATVNRWHKKFSVGGYDIFALLTRNTLKGNRKARKSKTYQAILEKAIETVYLNKQRRSMIDTWHESVRLVDKENQLLPKSMQMDEPKYEQIRRMIQRISAYDLTLIRRGADVANHLFRNAEHHDKAEHPLERAEIDHTILDVLVIDEISCLPLGRPTLTVCIDVNTRCILGMYIGFEPPSFNSVASCLKHAFFPKPNLSEKYPEIKNEWLPHGIMEALRVDNGLEFHSNSLENLCLSFNVTLEFTPRKISWYKGKIERLIGTMTKQTVQRLPGTTFSNIFEREDYDSKKYAVITLEALKKIINLWVVDIYHPSVHKTIGKAPIDAWNEKINPFEIPLPNSVNDFDGLLGETTERVLTHKGINLFNMQYNSRELGELRKKYGSNQKVTVRYNPNDIGYIYVFREKTGHGIKAPSLHLDLVSGMSAYQHKICSRYAKKHYQKNDILSIAKAKNRIQKIIAEQTGIKKIQSRKKAKRFVGDELSLSNATKKAHAQKIEITTQPRESDQITDQAIQIRDLTTYTPSGVGE